MSGRPGEERRLSAECDFSDAEDEAQSEVDFVHEVVWYLSDRFIKVSFVDREQLTHVDDRVHAQPAACG